VCPRSLGVHVRRERSAVSPMGDEPSSAVTAYHPAGKDARKLPASQHVQRCIGSSFRATGREAGTGVWVDEIGTGAARSSRPLCRRSLSSSARPTAPGMLSHGISPSLSGRMRRPQNASRPSWKPVSVHLRSAGKRVRSGVCQGALVSPRAVVAPGNDGSVSAALISSSSTLGGRTCRTQAGYRSLRRHPDRCAPERLWEGSQNGFMRMATDSCTRRLVFLVGASRREHVLTFADADDASRYLLHLIELLASGEHPSPVRIICPLLERQDR